MFSKTQASLLCLARALITNPEVLVLYSPTEGYDAITSKRVLFLLREFADEKGVGQGDATRHMRRPRTIIFSTASVMAAQFADKCFHVSQVDGIRELPAHQISAERMN